MYLKHYAKKIIHKITYKYEVVRGYYTDQICKSTLQKQNLPMHINPSPFNHNIMLFYGVFLLDPV